MSRSSHHLRQMQLHQQQQQQQQQMAENDAMALAAEIFDHFCVATTMRQILGLYRNMSDAIGLRPSPLNEFYPKLKAKIKNWKAAALWKKFDARASHRVYNKGNACTGTRVLVIGAGPCGLRTAIEAQLLGAKVVVIEKRDRISRNNVLHLWPFVITDLRNLGAKKFYGKFCAGSIDHISIRQLQCMLLKVALLLGVEVHEGVSFINTIEPSDGCGWRAQVSPEDHAVSHYEFDVLIGADGKRNTLEGFKRKEFRGKLAIAITANFINKKTEAEAKAEEISGVAFIFNQSFFKELYQTTGIDLENIVYYKDETHYFVMTAKKHSLIDKGVIIQDFADPAELLAPNNVNTEKLLDYAREAAEFSTKYQMPNLEFAVNHYGKPDVAMFDFTSMFAAEASCRVIVRKNYRLLQCLVGDSLLEPFWPTGSGCARGFLSSMDAAYAVKLWSNPKNSILGVLAQRESIYRLLAQTTPENLQRDIGAYTLDPASRYPNLNKSTVNVWQVKNLLDTDDKSLLEQTHMDTSIAQGAVSETPIRRKRRSGDTLPLSAILLRWIKAQLHAYEFTQHLNEVSDVFTSGKVLVALINRYRPDLVDLNTVNDWGPKECNELAFKILETEMGISRIMSSKESLTLEGIESKVWLNYLEQICEVFRGEIPHVKHPKLDLSEFQTKQTSSKIPDFSNLLQMGAKKAKSPLQDIDMTTNVIHRKSVLDEERLRKQRKLAAEYNSPAIDTSRRAKKRRSHEKSGTIEERQQRLQEIEANRQERQNRRKLQRYQQTQNFYKSLQMLHADTLLRQSDSSSPFEDYSIYLYRQQAPEFNDRVKELERKLLHPDRERGIPSAMPRGNDEQFSDRIKSMEQRITSRNNYGAEKKPKDLLRAIGKLGSNDWNIREIEKKIEQSKKTEIMGKNREKVPKWSKEQFLARQNKMSKPLEYQEGDNEKFKEIDQTIKNLDKQLRGDLEIGQRGKNKVASIAGQFIKKDDAPEEKNVPIPKSTSKVGLVFNKQAKTEKCYFCKQTVYLMERISAENLVLHRSCLKCHHCHTNLRLGGYAFDRDDPNGKFYCTQHYKLPAKEIRPVVRRSRNERKPTSQENKNVDKNLQTPVRGRPGDVAQLDLLDRGQTPERIEFENTDAMSDGEPSLENVIDENEWTDRNFITGDEETESDLSSSDSSDDSDSDLYEEADGSPIGAQTLQLANEWIGKQKYSNVIDSDDEDDFYDSSEGLLEDDADSQTEGEEFKKAREMRRQEVRLLPLPTYLPTDTETEVMTKNVIQTNDNTNNTDITTDTNNTNDKDNNKNTTENLDNDQMNNKKPDIIESIDNKTEEIKKAEGPSKIEIKTIERNLGRKVSTEIDMLNENLYNLNNLIKLNKEIENVEKENMVKNDIMKKLSLKEKWLNEQHSGMGDKVIDALQMSSDKLLDKNLEKNKNVEIDKIVENVEKFEIKNEEDKKNEGKKSTPTGKDKEIEDVTEQNQKESKESSEATNTSAVLKRSKFKQSRSEYVSNDNNKMNELEMKRLSITGKSLDQDMGKLLYDAEHKFSPTLNKKLDETMKKIEGKSFADTMDTIKAQIQTPKVSKQSSLDLSKYFPNQKQEKVAPVAKNTNQKNLKDVDLAKYFPQSPLNQRKASITSTGSATQSPAMNRKSEQSPQLQKKPISEKLFQPTIKTVENKTSEVIQKPKPNILNQSKPNVLNRSIPKRNNMGGNNLNETSNIKGNVDRKSLLGKQNSNESDLYDQLLDGAVDIKKSDVMKKTTTTSKKPQKKVNQNISSKTKKKTGANPKDTKKQKSSKVVNEEDKKFEEIFDAEKDERSPSKEYQDLFHSEKSPSTDLSDKINKIFKNEKVDLGTSNSRKRKVLKENSGDEEKMKSVSVCEIQNKIEPTETTESKNINKSNFEKKDEDTAKIRKTDEFLNTTVSQNKRNSMSDLEKTMEYLRTEWRTEATNFLQAKRNSFHAKWTPSPKDDEIKKKEKEIPKSTSSRKNNEIKEKEQQNIPTTVNNEIKNTNNQKLHSPDQRSRSESQVLEIEMDVNDDEVDSFLNQIMEEMKNNDEEIKIQSKSNIKDKISESKTREPEEVLGKKSEEKENVSADKKSEIKNEQFEILKTKNSERNLLLANPLIDIIEKPPTLTLSTQIKESNAEISTHKELEDKIDTSKNLLDISENVLEIKDNENTEIPCKTRASTEEDSIEELFKGLSDDMIVDVEFDSDGEIIAFIPKTKVEINSKESGEKFEENDFDENNSKSDNENNINCSSEKRDGRSIQEEKITLSNKSLISNESSSESDRSISQENEEEIEFENKKSVSIEKSPVNENKSKNCADNESNSSDKPFREFIEEEEKDSSIEAVKESEKLNSQKDNEIVNMGITYAQNNVAEKSDLILHENIVDEIKTSLEVISNEDDEKNNLELEKEKESDLKYIFNDEEKLDEDRIVDVSTELNKEKLKVVDIMKSNLSQDTSDMENRQNNVSDMEENFVKRNEMTKINDSSDENKGHFIVQDLDQSDSKFFPKKVLRRKKSVSSSLSPESSAVPSNTSNSNITKLNPADIPPSVQDILKKIGSSERVYFVGLNDEKPNKFPARYEDEITPDTNKNYEAKVSVSEKEENEKMLNENNEKYMTEEEYMEKLERERRKSLIRRDEMYAKQNASNPLILINDKTKKVKQIQENNRLLLSKSETEINSTKTSSPPKVPPRSPKSKRRLNREKQNSSEETQETTFPTDSLDGSNNSLSRSTESIPHRPQRTKNSLKKVDPGTDILLERSKMLHNLKEDFINDKMTGKNPYLRRIYNNKRTQSSDEDDESFQDALNNSGGRESNNYSSHFPTLKAIEERRRERRRSKTPEYVAGINRRFVNLSNALGSRNFVEYFRRSPSQPKEKNEQTKDSCVQSDTESSSSGNVELNSATEISTDSEFDHDPIIRETPRIFIDDTHIKKPTKVQVKQGVVTSSPTHKIQTNDQNQKISLTKEPPQIEFKPLVQVDPSLLNSNRLPLKNPRPGDYLLNKTPSTEGIASKKSLELKKRYLLGGEQGIGNGIMKSGSTSILDSKVKSFYSNISECQKLLHPGADISPSMRTFLDKTKIGDSNKNNNSEFTVKSSIKEFEKKDSEKENLFVNSRNELNKSATTSAIFTSAISGTNICGTSGIGGYSETINTTLVENMSKSMNDKKMISPILETIDLISPEKSVPLIDLTKVDIPSKMIKSNQNFIQNLKMEENRKRPEIKEDNDVVIDLTQDTPIKSAREKAIDKSVCDDKPDVSKDVKETIPDIITHIENVKNEKSLQGTSHTENQLSSTQPQQGRENNNISQQQKDNDVQETCIEVPNIPWNNKTKGESDVESDSLSSSTSSLEDIPHYILDSTTSPDTQNLGIEQIVPRLEVHDSSGALMQIDSLMIIDGKFIGDPEDLKLMEIPEGTKIELPTPPKTPENYEEKNKEKEKEDDDERLSSDKESTPTNKPKTVEINELSLNKNIEKQRTEIVEPDEKLIVVSSSKPNLKFDTKNENKIDTLKNMPFVIEKDNKINKLIKPTTLELGGNATKLIEKNLNDKDKTPTAERSGVSDSETEVTGQVLTETELSDWTADDAVSENFVDIEFALNSNKGTIKRNKKGKKKIFSSPSKLKTPTSSSTTNQKHQSNHQLRKQQDKIIKTPLTPKQDCGILKNLDIDEIEFMDTGSEGSCAETYSATNRAMLLNRGYIQFIENNANNLLPDSNLNTHNNANNSLMFSSNAMKEIPGVDYIEQGACILNNDYDLKTPVNETPPSFSKKQQQHQKQQPMSQQLMSQESKQSSTDTANEIDEDSLQYLTSQGTTDLYTTTEESEALTIVTSPLESGPKSSLPDNATTLSSGTDKNDKTSSATVSSKIPVKKSSSSEKERKNSEERHSKQSSYEDLNIGANKIKETDEMSYEEYVRKLQMKISQISNARDSIDVRKQKRKSSKGETSTSLMASGGGGGNGIESTQNSSVIESKSLSIFEPSKSMVTSPTIMSSSMTGSYSSSLIQQPQIQNVPESTKLEEIKKEKTKQKDLIHDLVMDKLQSKKQLNAEKRLNRSRNRNLFSPSHIKSPTTQIPVSNNDSCLNSPHYHIPSSTPERRSNKEMSITSQELQQKENIPTKIKSSPKENKDIGQIFINSTNQQQQRSKQRPLSDNLETVSTNLLFDQTPNITKTQSFCVYTPKNSSFVCDDDSLTTQQKSGLITDNQVFITPLPPPRSSRKYDEVLSASREKLRAEARARARLKSNEELGLSPEEKLQILRKRYHLDLHEISSSSSMTSATPPPPISTVSAATTPIESSNKSDEIKLRERKIITSKSVNDISAVHANRTSDEILNSKSQGDLVDFTSDPNLLSQQQQEETPIKCRRHKDPERRKSLIQTVSSFFNKKKEKDSPQSPTKEKSTESVFSRFRISPKSKEKSKDKDLTSSGDGMTCHSQDYLEHNIATVTTTEGAEKKSKTYSSSPQLCNKRSDDIAPPPIPPLPTNYQRSDDESFTAEPREQKKQRTISKASRQAELKRLRIAQEIQREQEEIEVKLKELEAKGVLIEKTLRGEGQNMENLDSSTMGASDEKLLKELLEIWRNITQLKKRDEELAIQQQELQLEHRHAQLREELDLRLSCSKLDKSSADVAAEGAILNEMLEIVAKRAALRPTETVDQQQQNENDDSDI